MFSHYVCHLNIVHDTLCLTPNIDYINHSFLPDGQVKFCEEYKLQKNCEINLLIKTFLGLVEMMFGLVNVSFSLPEWQAVKMTFFAPVTYCNTWTVYMFLEHQGRPHKILLNPLNCLVNCVHFKEPWLFLRYVWPLWSNVSKNMKLVIFFSSPPVILQELK